MRLPNNQNRRLSPRYWPTLALGVTNAAGGATLPNCARPLDSISNAVAAHRRRRDVRDETARRVVRRHAVLRGRARPIDATVDERVADDRAVRCRLHAAAGRAV